MPGGRGAYNDHEPRGSEGAASYCSGHDRADKEPSARSFQKNVSDAPEAGSGMGVPGIVSNVVASRATKNFPDPGNLQTRMDVGRGWLFRPITAGILPTMSRLREPHGPRRTPYTNMKSTGLVLVLSLVACGEAKEAVIDAPTEPGVADAGQLGTDAAPDGALAEADAHQGCAARDLDPAWLQDYEQEVLRKIAGVDPIAPGLTIRNRFDESNKEAVRKYLVAELQSFGYTPQRQTFENSTGTNVFARLGTGGPGRPVVVMGAHFDGIKDIGGQPVHAAADDGTGVALVLAAARWFKDVDCRDVDVIFAFFDQEENGLVGSNYFAFKLKDDHEHVIAAHTFDMISFDGNGDNALELWKPTAALQALYEEAVVPLGSKVFLAPHFSSSDHQSFLDAGFSATGVGELFVNNDHTNTYHTVNDTYDRVNFAYLRLISRVAFSAVSKQVAPNAP
jgi:Peptidase family M28